MKDFKPLANQADIFIIMDHAKLTGGHFLQAKSMSVLVLQARATLSNELVDYITKLEVAAYEAGRERGKGLE